MRSRYRRRAVQPFILLHRDHHHFSIRTGSARAVSIISPNAFFASRADMVFMADSRSDSCSHLGQNGSFEQRRIFSFGLRAWVYSQSR
jgi:hypothetical protein